MLWDPWGMRLACHVIVHRHALQRAETNLRLSERAALIDSILSRLSHCKVLVGP